MFKNITQKIFSLVKQNKWLFFVSILFIGWRFFLVSVFFDNEFSRSEESETYIRHIKSISSCSYLVMCKDFLLSFRDYFGFEHLSYRLFFGFIGKLLEITPTQVFHLSFYMGSVFLLPVLILFLKNIEPDKKVQALLLFFLLLYNGGRYHGFWWVVPGFFAMLFIFLIYAIILGNYKHWKVILLILVPVGFYIHMIFLYMMTTLVLFYFFYSFFTKKIDKIMLKKLFFSLAILPFLYFPTSYYLGEDNPYGLGSFIVNSNFMNTAANSLEENNKSSANNDSSPKIDTLLPETNNPLSKDVRSNLSEKKNLFPGFNSIKDLYFDWILFNPLFLIIFLYMIVIVFYYKQYKIISLYFSALTFTLISSINEHADRSLVFIWPITFLLYGYGIWFSFKIIREKINNNFVKLIAQGCLYVGIAFFAIINLLYSYGINTDLLFGLQHFLENYVWNYW